MGWLCTYANYGSVKEYAEHEIKCSDKYKLLDRSIYGKEVYSLYENIETGERFITIDLVTHSDGQWCIKSMDETCGPYYYNCPEYILVQSTCNKPLAVEWRKTCRELRIKKRKTMEAAKKLKANDKIQYKDNRVLTYLYPYNKSCTWIVCLNHEGKRYKYKVSDFKPEWLVPMETTETQVKA